MRPVSLRFDLNKVPFSRAGAYQSFSRLTEPQWWFHRGPPQLVWRTLHADAIGTLAELFVLRRGRKIAFREDAAPERLRLTAAQGSGWIEIDFLDSTTVRFRGQGLALRLVTPKPGDYDQIQPEGPRDWRLNFCQRKAEFLFAPSRGDVRVDAPWDGVRCTSIALTFSASSPRAVWEATAREVRWQQEARPPFAMEWPTWRALAPVVPEPLARTRDLAAYVMWSAVMDPYRNYRRPALVMSKNWMANTWTWDHCFNAIALAAKQPKLAWDQFMTPFDQQADTGQLPDFVGDANILWNFTKPPIHGWALAQMLQRTSWIGRAQLREIYPKLAAWTDWWFRERDSDHDGLPQYNHGNDSGWDNSTCFKVGMPVEGPDLAAFLVLQLDTLATVARRLGKPAQARAWTRRADKLSEKTVAHFWRRDRFVATRSGDHAVHVSDSLIPFIPLVLGERLPKAIREKLLHGLQEKGRFITAHGLATESPRSDQYEPDGYWRGPMWAPPVFLLVTGLERIGETALALRLARLYCRTCARSGMAENFDALTGKGLRDPAYTWTANVFLLLASEWLTRKT